MNTIRVDVIGVDHVGIGTDTKLTPAYRSFGPGPGGPAPQPGGGNSGNQDGRPRDNNSQNGPGGGQNRGRAGTGTNETWEGQNAGFYYTVVDAMLKTGFTEVEIGKIAGGNFCRIFDAATARHK